METSWQDLRYAVRMMRRQPGFTAIAIVAHVPPGFSTENILTMQLSLPKSKYPDSRADLTSGFFQQLIERVRTLPGVESAAVTSSLPLAAGGWGKLFTREDRPAPASLDEVPLIQYRQLSPDYFSTLRIPLLSGRYFSEDDNSSKTPVAIINQTLANRFFADEDPLGKQIKLGPPEEMLPAGILPAGFRFPRFTVVGVVGDIKHYGLNQRVRPEVYTPHMRCATNEGIADWAECKLANRNRQSAIGNRQ